MKTQRRGYAVLNSTAHNKSTAFSREEREALGLRGLLPYAVSTIEAQERRALKSMRRKYYDIEKYIFLNGLKERCETLFYRVLINNIEEVMPLIYTPTVGEACREFANIFRKPQGFYITPEDRGQIRAMLDNWPEDDVRVVVVTDGERILGLGDLGANGMGIPIGKLSLYCAGAGIHPSQCLPVMLDVGTNNDTLREDGLYLGYPHRRITGDAYDELVEEFVQAIQSRFPKALIQFEDFLTPNAFRLLDKYRDRVLCFNDDIEGTAAVALAGVYASTRLTGIDFSELRIMFLGAGSAATGIGDLIVAALEETGLDTATARRRLWFNNSKGLVVKTSDTNTPHIEAYAHDHEPMSFLEAIESIEPHILIGATGSPGTFTEEVVATMARLNERPTIFALSNPTSRAECTAEQAYRWSDGRAIFASGSPFAEVEYNGQRFRPGQGNNAYIFPGVGLGAVGCEASVINDDMFLAAAKTLAGTVSENDLERGTLYPPLTDIRSVSKAIAVAVAETAYRDGVARLERPADLEAHLESIMYWPDYD